MIIRDDCDTWIELPMLTYRFAETFRDMGTAVTRPLFDTVQVRRNDGKLFAMTPYMCGEMGFPAQPAAEGEEDTEIILVPQAAIKLMKSTHQTKSAPLVLLHRKGDERERWTLQVQSFPGVHMALSFTRVRGELPRLETVLPEDLLLKDVSATALFDTAKLARLLSLTGALTDSKGTQVVMTKASTGLILESRRSKGSDRYLRVAVMPLVHGYSPGEEVYSKKKGIG